MATHAENPDASAVPPPGAHPAGEPHHKLSTQLVRFVITGGLSAVVDFGLLNLLMLVFGWEHTWAKAVSFIAGTTTAYMINRRWTFRAEPSTKRFIAIVILYAITFALQVGLFSLLFWMLQGTGLPVVVINAIAFVIAQGVATTVNFIVQRTVIFKIRPAAAGR
ncbi:GtrA family protein [Propionibacteriaceae bacterium Y1685]